VQGTIGPQFSGYLTILSASQTPGRARPILVSLVLLSLAAPSAVASKLYKWVDADGQVHYSQQAPPDGTTEADRMNTPGTTQSALSVKLKGEYEYCGTMRLPGPVYQERKVMASILREEDRWTEKLRAKELQLRDFYAKVAYGKRHSRRNDSYVHQQSARLKKDIDQLRCALSWAERKRSNMGDYRQEVTEDLGRLRFNFEELSRRQAAECGAQPAGKDAVDRYPRWDKCMNRYRSRIKRTKRDIDRLEVQLQQFR
jgi:hypothetical protein